MIRTDLRNGMVIEYRDGEKAIVKDDLFLDIIDLSTDSYISDYDINFNDTDEMDDWKIMKIYDNIINMNLLWERKDTSSKIKPIGYEYKGYKLGDKVRYKDRFENIVGFDESEVSIFNILITATVMDEETMEFKDAGFISSSLNVAETQLVKWADSSEIDNIEENEDIIEPTPKVKIPKYVKIVKCSNDEFWYNNRIGKIYRVNGIHSECGYETIDEEDGNKAGIKIKDCIPIKKKDLFKVGMKVKIKKSRIGDIMIFDIPYIIKDIKYEKGFTYLIFEELDTECDIEYFKPYIGN